MHLLLKYKPNLIRRGILLEWPHKHELTRVCRSDKVSHSLQEYSLLLLGFISLSTYSLGNERPTTPYSHRTKDWPIDGGCSERN